MKVFYIVAGIVITVMSLLLVIATPIGFLGIALGVFLIIYGKKYKKPKVETTAPIQPPSAPIQPPTEQTKPEPAETGFKRETIKVAGISQFTDNVLSLGSENPDYSLSKKELIEAGLEDEKIKEYDFRILPATFEFEPDNQYDSNAIAVYVAGVKIGYVKSGSTAHIRKLIQQNKIEARPVKLSAARLNALILKQNPLKK